MSDINKMFTDLEQAESLIDSVYHYAMETGNDELRQLMNMAGTACSDGRQMLPKIGTSEEFTEFCTADETEDSVE